MRRVNSFFLFKKLFYFYSTVGIAFLSVGHLFSSDIFTVHGFLCLAVWLFLKNCPKDSVAENRAVFRKKEGVWGDTPFRNCIVNVFTKVLLFLIKYTFGNAVIFFLKRSHPKKILDTPLIVEPPDHAQPPGRPILEYTILERRVNCIRFLWLLGGGSIRGISGRAAPWWAPCAAGPVAGSSGTASRWCGTAPCSGRTARWTTSHTRTRPDWTACRWGTGTTPDARRCRSSATPGTWCPRPRRIPGTVGRRSRSLCRAPRPAPDSQFPVYLCGGRTPNKTVINNIL